MQLLYYIVMVLPYINMNQPQTYMCLLPPELFSDIFPPSIPLGCHRALALGVLCHKSNPF